MTLAMHRPRVTAAQQLAQKSLYNGVAQLTEFITKGSFNRLAWLACVPLGLMGLGLFNLAARAQEAMAGAEPEISAAFLANNLWLLIATILVIFMNAGFAMVEAGMCRQKNAVNILSKNLFVFALAVSAYWLMGYSIMYGDPVAGGWLYWNQFFFDPYVSPETIAEAGLVPTVDFLFQAAFAGTAATIVSGLVAERIKFGEFVIFSLILTGIIYPISGSWQWNGGWLSEMGFIDFAGSSIVHSVGAWAGVVGAALLGPRIGKFVNGQAQAMPGHNMGIATLGCLVLWIGWYGFNPGSELAMDQYVPFVAVTTTLAAAGGGIGAALLSKITSGKPDLTMIINGILAGLVSITAGCGNMTLAGSWIAGFIGGLIVVISVGVLDGIGIDDPVGAFSVHGTCGIWGTLVIGLWGVEGMDAGAAGIGLLNGGGFAQLGSQIVGCLAYGIWTVVTCFIAWKIIGSIFGGIRVTEEEELTGLDIGEHGMEAYPEFASSNS